MAGHPTADMVGRRCSEMAGAGDAGSDRVAHLRPLLHLVPSPISHSVIPPFPVSLATERAAERAAVLATIVAAAWLTWASLRHDFDLRWWSVLGPLLAAGIPRRLRLADAYRADGPGQYWCRVRDLDRGPFVAAVLG